MDDFFKKIRKWKGMGDGWGAAGEGGVVPIPTPVGKIRVDCGSGGGGVALDRA